MQKVSQATPVLFHKKSNRNVEKNWFKYSSIKLSHLFSFLLAVATCTRQAPMFLIPLKSPSPGYKPFFGFT